MGDVMEEELHGQKVLVVGKDSHIPVEVITKLAWFHCHEHWLKQAVTSLGMSLEQILRPSS
jgi:hypothetical protein